MTELLRPSQLQQYSLCPGSYRMQSGMPDQPSPDAEEGTMLHAVLAGETPSVELTSEQSDLIEQCREYLTKVREVTGLDEVRHEVPLTIRDDDGEELTHGTADVLLSSEDADRCAIIDWKFGRVPVTEVSGNLQLAAYALGAMQLTNTSECEAHIFQPRLGQHTSHTFASPDAIRRNVRAVIARATQDGAMVLAPGEAQCRYCRAKAACPAFQREAGAISTIPSADLTDPARLAEFYEKAQLVKRYCADIEDAMRRYLDEHGECAGYRWKEVAGRREVDDISHAAIMLSDIIARSEFLGACTVSVSALESVVCDRLVTRAKALGEKLTLKDAKKQFAELMEGVILRGKPTRKIVKEDN